jgi:serine/threonine protein kinase
VNEQQTSSPCDAQKLNALLLGRLSSAEQSSVEAHLSECPACAEQLERAAVSGTSWNAASSMLAPDELDGAQSLSSVPSLFPGEAKAMSQTQTADVLAREIRGWLDPTDDPDSLGRFAGYEIVGLIGHGGMGIMLKGFESSLNRYVAIKVLAPRLATNGTARKRFAREARAAAAVLHENVIAIHRVDEWHGLPFLVMPYIGGDSLQKRLDDEGPFSIEAALRVGVQIAAGLAAAHERGLVHRDIKPANILLNPGVERVTITDFGLARAIDDASMTRTGIIAGTPQYMSPEQAEARAIDGRSDLFSLGSVLYAMATGRPPFRGDGGFDVLKRVGTDAARPLREIDATIPAWFENLVARLHAKSADDRPQSAGEVQRLLTACLLHLTQPDQPVPRELLDLPKRKRQRGRYVAGFAGLLLLAVALAGSFLQSSVDPAGKGNAKPASSANASSIASSPSSPPEAEVPVKPESSAGEASAPGSLDPLLPVGEWTSVSELAPSTRVTSAEAGSPVRGRVVGHDGRTAVAGARLYWYRTRVYDLFPMQPRLIAESAEDGTFSFTPPVVADPDEEPANWDFREKVVVIAEGHGFQTTWPTGIRNYRQVRLPPAGEPLRGRIVDTDGRPVANATIRIRHFEDIVEDEWSVERSRSEDKALTLWQGRVLDLLNTIEPVPERFALPTATTNANGEFELKDVGPNRLLQLLVEGEGIQTDDVIARNLEGETIDVPEIVGRWNYPAQTVSANDFLYVAAPSIPVSGQVVDVDTQQPIANALVCPVMLLGERVSYEYTVTRTDEQGRYEIRGMPIGNDNRLLAFAAGDIPYVPVGQRIESSLDDTTAEANFSLKRCVWAEGRVFDEATGEPFAGEIQYFWFRDKALEEAIPGLRWAEQLHQFFTTNRGEFRVPIIPTPGVLAYKWDASSEARRAEPRVMDRFPRGLGEDRFTGQYDNSGGYYRTEPRSFIPASFNFLAEVNPEQGDDRIEIEMALRASKPVRLQIVSRDDRFGSPPEGPPEDGYEAYGLNKRAGWQKDQSTQLVAEDLLPGEKRTVYVFHRASGLGGAVAVDEDVQQPVDIELTMTGRLIGRLVDDNGKPITDGVLSRDGSVWASDPKLKANPTLIPVDQQGRFVLNGLIPGRKYSARVSAPRGHQGRLTRTYVGMAFSDVEIEPGETRDLGDLSVTFRLPSSLQKASKNSEEETKSGAKISPAPST